MPYSPAIEQKNVGPWWKFFWQGCQIWILPILEELWETDWFFFGSTANYLRQGCQNFTLYVQRNSLRKKNIHRKLQSFHHFRTMGEKVLALWQFVCGGVVKTKCYLSLLKKIRRKHFWKGKIFSSLLVFQRMFFGLLSNFFLRGCRNCILLVPRITSGGKFCFEKNTFFHCIRTFLFFGKIRLTGLFLNCILHVHENIFRKDFFPKTNSFPSLCEIERNVFFQNLPAGS